MCHLGSSKVREHMSCMRSGPCQSTTLKLTVCHKINWSVSTIFYMWDVIIKGRVSLCRHRVSVVEYYYYSPHSIVYNLPAARRYSFSLPFQVLSHFPTFHTVSTFPSAFFHGISLSSGPYGAVDVVMDLDIVRTICIHNNNGGGAKH